SKETENILVKQNINTPKRILHLGTNTNEFIPNKNIKKQKIKMKYDKNDFIIGYCGRISYEKDLLTLFEAYKDIKDSYPDHSIKLLIVGGGDKQLIEKIKQKDIFITGFVNNVIDYYQIMDIFVLPSLTETSSISTMEAMSCEIPVITTRVGFLNTYIKDGENGLHFKTKDKFELIEKLRLLIEDEKYRKKLSKNGRKTIVESYSWKETTSKLNRILNTIIQNIHEKAK
ncbi:glycosyltransferase family 4 protein, partial [Candidatus Woesearchaeota archaeon]|nr:glycosyltransferase family 4 protein [Candidatus Woesearchaeota archaeon]